ncbi:MAG: uracil-DNA glycosylase [Planctomycetota bacterium]
MADQPDLQADLMTDATRIMCEHLQRSGIHLVPRPRQSNVAAWRDRIGIDRESVDAHAISDSETKTRLDDVSPSPGPKRITVMDSIESAAKSRLSPVPPMPTPTMLGQTTYPESLSTAERQAALTKLTHRLANCKSFKHLNDSPMPTVFGEGNPNARFVFFGEGPGIDEQRLETSDVERSRQLMTKMIEATNLKRDEVFVTNTMSRQPNEQSSSEGFVSGNYREHFEQQIEIIQPEYIICLGSVSARILLQTKLGVGRLRQRFHPYRDSKVLVTYPPAYLLRNPEAKRAAWADLQMLMDDAGLR